MMRVLPKLYKFKKIQRWSYVVLGLIVMICMGTVYSWSVFRLQIERLYNIGAFESGLPYMIALAFYALFMFFSGRYLNKHKPRTIMMIGASLISLGWILSAYATDIYILTITYGCLSGAGVGIVYGIPLTVVAKWFPEKKGVVTGIILAGFGLSPLITAPLATHLIDCYSITKTFLILGISFGAAISLCSLAFKYPPERENNIVNADSSTKKYTDNVNTSDMIKSKNFKGLYINFIIGTMIGLMLIGMTSNVGIDLIKLSPKDVTLLMSLFAVFNGIGRPVFGWLTDKFSSKKAMIISYGLVILSAFLMLLAKEGSVVLFGIAFSVFWFNLGGWLAIAPTSTLAMYGTKHYSQNYGVVFTAYGIGAISGVLTSGVLLDVLQYYQPIFYFIILLSALGIKLSQITVTR
ncbi:MAG: L-lactate MFS transporter [Christensenellales bacterium]